mmetsp:Transcript_23697/g.69360  ORF Transcript_23697/g.69360 Transcript_23697/m.69360 type:complete len:298 (-) Transcript_23697:114-1007(-)
MTTRAPSVRTDGWDKVSDQVPVWEPFDESLAFQDISFVRAPHDGICQIVINRPAVHNAFRPVTIAEISRALQLAQDDVGIGVIILAGEGPHAFCSGGDQKLRAGGGYDDGSEAAPRLRVLDLQIQMRRCPKPIIAKVAGYAVGGGHILHMVADLTIAADNAVFGQTGPRVGSFDAGYGSTHMARIIGQKRAREFWFLCKFYNAEEALQMGLVNAVVPLADLEGETVKWCRRILQNSPTALACLKAALNSDEDGQAGVQMLAGMATRLFYLSDEGREGNRAFKEKRPPNFRGVPTSKL